MDDSDDKARRNLVVASAGVLLCGLAGISVTSIVERLLGLNAGASPNHLAPSRVLGATLLILLYLGSRFRFAAQTAEAYAAMKDEWHASIRALVEREIRAELRRYMRTGIESPIFEGTLRALVAERTESMQEGRDSAGNPTAALGRPSIECDAVGVDAQGRGEPSLYAGHLGLSYSWPELGASATGGAMGSFRIDGARRLAVRAMAVVRMVLYSRSSLQLIIPAFLGTAAIGTLSIQWLLSLR